MPLLNISKKPKGSSLWTKCQLEIENYTLNLGLRDSLFRYLELRLAMKDKPLYGVGQWKGLLKKLSNLSPDTSTQIKIVEQSIERGWATFVELNSRYTKNNFGEYVGINCDDSEEEEVRGYF